MNRVEKEFEARKKKILKSAKKLFIKYGFDNVSLNQIAKDAEFGKSTLYHYFSSKNEILYLIIRQHDMRRLKSCNKSATIGITAYEKIYNYLTEYYKFVKKDYEIFMLTYKNNYLLYRDIIQNLSKEYYEKYERHFNETAVFLKEQLKLGEQDGYFQKIEDKDFQLGYIMVTTRGLIFFLFQHLYITHSLTEKEIDNYFKFHLNMILINL